MHLAQFMAVRGLSDADVAAGIGRSRPTISRIRRRLVRPDWQTLDELARYSDGLVTANDFVATSQPEAAE